MPSPPTYRKVNPADAPIMILSATSETLPLTEVDDNVDTKLAQQISQISGVGFVSIGGEQKPAIRVQLDPAKLVNKGLSLEDVRAQLAITTVNQPKGNLDGAQRSFTIYANDQLTDAKYDGRRPASTLCEWPAARHRHRVARCRRSRGEGSAAGPACRRSPRR